MPNIDLHILSQLFVFFHCRINQCAFNAVHIYSKCEFDYTLEIRQHQNLGIKLTHLAPFHKFLEEKLLYKLFDFHSWSHRGVTFFTCWPKPPQESSQRKFKTYHEFKNNFCACLSFFLLICFPRSLYVNCFVPMDNLFFFR